MLSLIDLVLTIPATSVKAERGFSVMKRVKTDFRNKLANPALNDLLRIILLSPAEVGFDPLPAIQHWHAALQRRQPRERPAPQTQEQDEHSLPSLTDLLQDASAKNPPGIGIIENMLQTEDHGARLLHGVLRRDEAAREGGRPVVK